MTIDQFKDFLKKYKFLVIKDHVLKDDLVFALKYKNYCSVHEKEKLKYWDGERIIPIDFMYFVYQRCLKFYKKPEKLCYKKEIKKAYKNFTF